MRVLHKQPHVMSLTRSTGPTRVHCVYIPVYTQNLSTSTRAVTLTFQSLTCLAYGIAQPSCAHSWDSAAGVQ